MKKFNNLVFKNSWIFLGKSTRVKATTATKHLPFKSDILYTFNFGIAEVIYHVGLAVTI